MKPPYFSFGNAYFIIKLINISQILNAFIVNGLRFADCECEPSLNCRRALFATYVKLIFQSKSLQNVICNRFDDPKYALIAKVIISYFFRVRKLNFDNMNKKHSIADLFEAQRKKARTNEQESSNVVVADDSENMIQGGEDDGNRSGYENEDKSGINILIDKLTLLNRDRNKGELISIGINIVLSTFSLVEAPLSDVDDDDNNQLDLELEPNPTSRTY